MILVDTTALVYAVGEEHPLRAPGRALVAAVQRRQVTATTTPEVIQEFVHVRARRRSRGNAATLGRDWARLLDPLLSTDGADLGLGLELFEQHRRLDAFDALLAAVAMRRGAEALVSADRSFADVAGVRFVDLGGPELEQLVAP